MRALVNGHEETGVADVAAVSDVVWLDLFKRKACVSGGDDLEERRRAVRSMFPERHLATIDFLVKDCP